MHDTTPRLMADLTGARVLPIQVAPNGCDDCSVEPSETHRYAACPGNQHRTVTTPTAFPGFAPGDARYLLAEVNRWARTNGWRTHRDTGWQNPSRLTQVDWDERGLHIGSRDGVDRIWPNPTPYPARSVRQAVALLVALDILPAKFSPLADTMRRLADELETEAAVHDAPAGSMFLDAGFRIRLTLDGEYEPTGDAR